MDNLLPALANIDVTSNQFRETVLPYQQWEVRSGVCVCEIAQTFASVEVVSSALHKYRSLAVVRSTQKARGAGIRAPSLLAVYNQPTFPCAANGSPNLDASIRVGNAGEADAQHSFDAFRHRPPPATSQRAKTEAR